MTFVKRKIRISIKLASASGTNQPNTFAESGTDTVTVDDARCRVRIQNSGAPAGSQAQVDVYGLAPSLMNQLSTLGLAFNLVPRNTISISAGDDDSGLAVVFGGTIIAGYGDYNQAPDVPFHLEAQAGLAEAVLPASPSSYTGPTDAATILSNLAQQMGKGFENNGVSVKLSNPYYSGNLWTQVREVARDAGVNAELVDGGTKLAIWPMGGARGDSGVLLSKDTGMIGYPAFTQQGIMVRSLFNPAVTFGSSIKVESVVLSGVAAAQKQQSPGLKVASTWAIQKLDHALDSLVPHGLWESTIFAYNPNYPKPIPTGA